MEINQRIFSLLKEQNKTARQLSEFIGVSQASISAWKNENSYPSSKHIISISEFFHVSSNYLLTGKIESSVSNNSIAHLPTNDIWKLNERQKEALSQHLNMLTEEQAALINNYEKLTPHDKKEIRSIIKMKLSEYEQDITGSVEAAGL